jgi:hypothetical protein
VRPDSDQSLRLRPSRPRIADRLNGWGWEMTAWSHIQPMAARPGWCNRRRWGSWPGCRWRLQNAWAVSFGDSQGVGIFHTSDGSTWSRQFSGGGGFEVGILYDVISSTRPPRRPRWSAPTRTLPHMGRQ